MLERMNQDHLKQVIDIHASSWGKDEISVKLGDEYLKLFYVHLIRSPHSFAYIYRFENEVVAYATGFYDYRAFNRGILRQEKFRLFLILLKRCMKKKISWADIRNLMVDKRKFRKAKYPKHHVGALALSNIYKGTVEGRKAITKTIETVLKELENHSCPGCSACCDARNIPMRNYFLRLGFEEIDTINFMTKQVVMFEKSFHEQ
jgi:hypothetical protein